MRDQYNMLFEAAKTGGRKEIQDFTSFVRNYTRNLKEMLKMETKLEIRLEVWDNHTLIFELISLDKRFWYVRDYETFDSENGICIGNDISSDYTANFGRIEELILGLPDSEFNVLPIVGLEDAEKEKEHLIIALQDWANNWKGFKNDVVEGSGGNINIYTF